MDEERGNDTFMATTTTALQMGLASEAAMPVAGQMRRRSIDPQTGRALEILGHAIEYLADEFAFQGRSLTADRGQIEAIQLLMAINRQIYLQCPEVLTFGQWLRSLLHPQSKVTAKPVDVGSKLGHGRA